MSHKNTCKKTSPTTLAWPLYLPVSLQDPQVGWELLNQMTHHKASPTLIQTCGPKMLPSSPFVSMCWSFHSSKFILLPNVHLLFILLSVLIIILSSSLNAYKLDQLSKCFGEEDLPIIFLNWAVYNVYHNTRQEYRWTYQFVK